MSHISSSVTFIENRLKGTKIAWQETEELPSLDTNRDGPRFMKQTQSALRHSDRTRTIQSAPPNRKPVPRKYTASNELSRHRLAVSDAKYELLKGKKKIKRKRKKKTQNQVYEGEYLQEKPREEDSFQVLSNVLTKMQIEDVLPQRSFFSLKNNVYGAHRRYKARSHSAGEGQLNDEYSIDKEVETAVSHQDHLNVEFENVNKSLNSQPQIGVPFFKDEYENKAIQVDPGPLIKYLKLVQENPEEYEALKCGKVRGRKAQNSLISLGKVFARRHLGLGHPDTLIIHAAYEIKPKVYVGIKKKEKKDQKAFKLHFDPYAKVTEPQKKEDENISPLRAAWKEVEKWMRELTTAQFVKARELAIRELGEEDHSIKRWWVAHRYCRYLRLRGSTEIPQ